MITGVAFVPQAPALDPGVGRGLDAELGALRTACRTAIAALDTCAVALVGDDPFGVGDYLVRDALGTGPVPDSAALVVLGDGTACRSEKAPGYYDERAEPFDVQVAEALGSGDPAGLAALDPVLGAELLAAGVPVWRRIGAELSGRYDAELRYDDAPFGVGYFVAVWRRA